MRPMFGLCGCYLNPEHVSVISAFPPDMLLLIEISLTPHSECENIRRVMEDSSFARARRQRVARHEPPQ